MRVFQKLQPQDEEAFQAITGVLGYEVKQVTMAAAQRTEKGEPLPKIEAAKVSKPTGEAGPKPGRARKPMESELIDLAVPENALPDWLQTVPHLEETKPSKMTRSLPLEPLFQPNWTRTILSDALSTPSSEGEPDIAAIVEKIGCAQPLTELPRHMAPTLARGVQLLIDYSEAMEPFASDQIFLRDEILKVVGKDKSEVLAFSGSPLRGVGVGLQENWADYEPPIPGTPVLVLTDLGIGQPEFFFERADVHEWLEFAALIRKCSCPLIAFVPYPETRWPNIRQALSILQWDRPTNASTVRSLVQTRLRVARES